MEPLNTLKRPSALSLHFPPACFGDGRKFGSRYHTHPPFGLFHSPHWPLFPVSPCPSRSGGGCDVRSASSTYSPIPPWDFTISGSGRRPEHPIKLLRKRFDSFLDCCCPA